MKNKGQAQTAAVNLLVFATLGIISILIFGQFSNQASTQITTTTGLAAAGNFSNNTFNGFQVISIGPTVLAAVAVLTIVGLLLHIGRR